MEKIKVSTFVENIAEQTGLSKKQSGEAVNAVFAEIKKQLLEGKAVGIPGFGTFSVGTRAARTGKNPQTGETIEISAKNTASFKASSVLKQELNQ